MVSRYILVLMSAYAAAVVDPVHTDANLSCAVINKRVCPCLHDSRPAFYVLSVAL